MLSMLFGKKEKVVGFIYVPDSNQGHFKHANVGQTIKTEKKGPPWIVVDHSLESVVIAKWPGTLWLAEVKDEAKNTGLLEYAKYTRANAVKIINKLPLEILFGDFGGSILKIIESAKSIDTEIVKKLANVFSPESLELYSKGWNIFGGTKNDLPPFYGRDHQNTIAMPGNKGCSPINSAFKIIYSQVFDRANELTGGKVLLTDDEGCLLLDDEWSKACNSYLCAAMAVAYQEKFTENEIAVLSKGWAIVYGKLPLSARNPKG